MYRTFLIELPSHGLKHQSAFRDGTRSTPCVENRDSLSVLGWSDMARGCLFLYNNSCIPSEAPGCQK